MFEHLKNDPAFQTLDTEGRRNWLENYKFKEIEPVLQGVSEEERQVYNKRVDDAFWADTQKTDWETFRDFSHDLVMSTPRLGTRVTGTLWEGIEAGADAVGADKLAGYAKAQADYLSGLSQKMVKNPDTQYLTDTLAESIPVNAFIGRTMWAYRAMTSPWARQVYKYPLIKALFSTPADTALGMASGMTASAATRSYAISGTVGDLAIAATMNKYVQPAIDATDMGPTAKQWSTLGAYFLLGFGSGVGPELALDKVLGNPLWKNTMDLAISSAAKGASHVNIPERVWNSMDPADKAMVTLVHTPDVDAIGNMVKAFRRSREHERIDFSEAAIKARGQKIADDIIKKVWNKVDDVDGTHAHAAQKELMDSPEVREILNTPDEVVDEVIAEMPDVFGPSPKITQGEAPAKPKKKQNLSERAKEKRLLAQEAEAQMVKAEKQGFETWAKTAEPQTYQAIVNAYERGPIIGRRKVKELLGDAPNPDLHKAIQQHVKEIGDDGVHPSRRQPQAVEPERPAASTPALEPEAVVAKAEVEVAKPVESSKVEEPGAEAPKAEQPVTKPTEQPAEKPAALTEPTKPVEQKVAPVQPAQSAPPVVRTTHNLPVSEEVIPDPRWDSPKRVVKFPDSHKPSNEQVEVLKAAGAEFDRNYMGWRLPDTPESIEAIKQVRRMAAPVKEKVDTPAKTTSTSPEPPADAKPVMTATGSVPIHEFVANSGQRVLKFHDNAKPSSVQSTYMKQNGVFWSAQYKGWIGADSARTREVMQAVRAMADGVMPADAGSAPQAARKAGIFTEHVKTRKKNLKEKLENERTTAAHEGARAAQQSDIIKGRVTIAVIDDVADPELVAWLRKNNMGASVRNGQGVQLDDLPGILKQAYNEFGPDSVLTDDMLKQHVNLLDKLEKLSAAHARPIEDGQFEKGLAKLRKVGVLTAQQYEVAMRVTKQFKNKINASIAPGQDREFYNILANVINIKNADNLFHELGHYAWWRGLTGEDRIKFFEALHYQHRGKERWNKLSPMRAAYIRLAESPLGTQAMKDRVGTSYDLVTELYADVFRQYIHTYRMTDAESLAFIRKGAGEMEPVLAVMRELPDLPLNVRQHIDSILLRPRGDNKPDVRNIKKVMEENYRFIDRQTFEDSISHLVDDTYGDAVSDSAVNIMRNQAVNPDAWAKTGDFEPALNRMLVETLGFFHYGAGDIERLDRMIYGLAKQFDRKNYEATLKLIAKAEAKNMEGLKLPKEQMAEHVKLLYNDYKQFINDIAAIHEAAKIEVRGSSTGAMDAESFIMKQQLALKDAAQKENVKYHGKTVSYDDTLGKAESSADEIDQWKLNPDDPNYELAPGAHTQNTLMRWRMAPQVVSALMGLEVDNEAGIPVPFTSVYLNWNPVTWAKRGGPLLSLYDAFGKSAWRMAKDKMFTKWANLSPHQQTAITQKWNALTKNDFVRGLRPNSGLPENVADIVRSKWKTEAAYKRRVDTLAQDLNSRFTTDELRLMGDIISQEQGVNVGMLTPEAQAAMQLVEQLVADAHQVLLRAGVSQQLLDEKGLSIIPLVFERQGKAYWKQGVEGIRNQNVHETIGTPFLAHQGRHELWKHSSGEVASLMQLVRNTGRTLQPGDLVDEFLDSTGQRLLAPAGMNLGTPLHTWKIKEFNTQAGTIKVNRKFTQLEKQIMKAENALPPRLVQFSEDFSKFVARAQAFDDISNNPNLAQDINAMRQAQVLPAHEIDIIERNMMQRGWQYVPDTEVIPGVKRYGKLAGKLVDPEAMYAIKAETGTAPNHPLANAIFTKYRQGVSLWKIGKTAFNPTTHGINFLGNSVMCALDGRNPLSVLKEGIVGLRERGQFYQEAVEAGMVDSNILRSELGLERWLRTIEAQPNQHPTAGFYGAASSWIDGVSKLSKNVAKKAAYVPMRAYELGDQVYKMGVFVQARKAGMSADDAMKEANRLFFDYRDVPKGIKTIRDWGIMPFISYTYKLLPRMADFATNNPHRLIALIGGLQMFNNVLMANAFGEDWQDVEKFYNEMTPDWMNRKLFGTESRGGLFMGQYTNERGQNYSEWLDYSQIIPGATQLDDGGIFGGFPFGTNPLVSIMYGLSANKDAQLGMQIAPYPEAENPEFAKRNTEARLKFIARSLLPNLPMYPGAYSLERLGQGLTDAGAISPDVADKMGWTGKDYYGTPEDAADAFGSWMSGVRNRRLYAKQELIRKMDKLEFGIKKEENELERRYEDQRMTKDELMIQQNKMKAVTLHNVEELRRLGKVYRKAQRVLAPQETEN